MIIRLYINLFFFMFTSILSSQNDYNNRFINRVYQKLIRKMSDNCNLSVKLERKCAFLELSNNVNLMVNWYVCWVNTSFIHLKRVNLMSLIHHHHIILILEWTMCSYSFLKISFVNWDIVYKLSVTVSDCVMWWLRPAKNMIYS